MKKRKELDALVANGKLGRNIRKTKKGQHELLRSETDSSEIEEFSILTPRKNSLRKTGPSHLCSAFVPVCVFILVAACGVCSGALIWMHFNLRTDLDVVREHLQKVESSNKGLPEEFHSIDTRIKDLEADHSALVTELSKLTSKVSSIIGQIGLLNQTTKSLQQSIAAAPEIKALPNEVKNLLQNYANMGSSMKELQNIVDELKEKQKSYDADKEHLVTALQRLQDEMGEIKSHSNPSNNLPATTNPSFLTNIASPLNMAPQTILTNFIHEELNQISTSLDFLNTTFTPKIQFLTDDMNQHHIEIAELQNSTNLIQNKIGQLEKSVSQSSLVETLRQKLEDFIEKFVDDRLNNDSLGIDSDSLLLLKNMSKNVKILKQQFDKLKSKEDSNPFIGNNGSVALQNFINTSIEEVSKDHVASIKSLKEAVDYLHNSFSTQVNEQVEMKSQIATILQILDKMNNHMMSNNKNLTAFSNNDTGDEENFSKFIPAENPISLFEEDDNKASQFPDDILDQVVPTTVDHSHSQETHSSLPIKSQGNQKRWSSSELLDSLVKKLNE